MRSERKIPHRWLTIPALLVLMILAGAFVLWSWSRSARVVQPLAFNHLAHTTTAEMACEDCHSYLGQGQRAGLPDVETCMFCHSEPVTESPEEAKLRELYDLGEPVRFRKLFHLPSDVYYSHRRHAVLGEIECEQCHGDIEKTQSPPLRPLVTVTMEFCMECHSNSQVTNDCKSCHR